MFLFVRCYLKKNLNKVNMATNCPAQNRNIHFNVSDLTDSILSSSLDMSSLWQGVQCLFPELL